MKTLRLLLIVLLALTESVRAWGVQTMVTGAMFGVPCAGTARATAPTPPMAGAHDDCAQAMRMSGAGHAAPAGGAASRQHRACPLCSVVTATPPGAVALLQPALRQTVLRHGLMLFHSTVPETLDRPPRRSI